MKTAEGDLDIIKSVLTKMATQDNRCTAFPFYYVIEDQEKHHNENGSMIERYCQDCCEIVDPDDEDYFCEEENHEVNLQHYDWKPVYTNFFLTEDDAEAHLKSNHYHYSPHARTYVKHMWRSHETEEFFRALMAFFKVERGEHRPMTKLEKACAKLAEHYAKNWSRPSPEKEEKNALMQAFISGFKAALKPEHMKLTPEVQGLVEAVKSGSHYLFFYSQDRGLEEFEMMTEDAFKISKALKPFENNNLTKDKK